MTQRNGEPPAVSLTGAEKTFGDVRAVAGLDLTVARGETVALLGLPRTLGFARAGGTPIGAGKSTAISLLLGLNEPDAGRVELFGGPPRRAVRAGRVGAMLQETRPVPRVTVRELVAFVAGRHPAPLTAARALEPAGVPEPAGRRVDRLSGGQLQRVRFAVALAGDPDLLVLDEPTAALDVAARQEFWAALRGRARHGRTVLFCTHHLEEADAHADRIVVVDRGRVVADGTGEELRRRVGGGVVSFDLAEGGGEGLELLPGVRAVEVRGGRARLRTDDSDATVLAPAERGAIRRLEVAPASLDDAFLALTSPDVRPLETV
ncbi:ATP-binding cassette domain-containing protein [Streptomyces echinoruber]|nr:ABC transporter ATP-binding protein [Streptomyces echinoruber]